MKKDFLVVIEPSDFIKFKNLGIDCFIGVVGDCSSTKVRLYFPVTFNLLQ